MKRTAIIIAIIVATLVIFGGWWFVNSKTAYSGPAESITVAWSPFEHTALFYVAQDRGFFSGNGLAVTPRKYNSGAGALSGVLNGEADIAVGVTEFPLVKMAFQAKKVYAIATIDKSNMIYLVARKDRGINKPSDLKGKKIGTAIGTIAEFYLGRFLELNGMSMQDIILVDLKTPEEWVNEVANGNIDAVSTAQPDANSAKDKLGDNAMVWRVQSDQPMNALVISTSDWIQKHPRIVEKFLKSLLLAEEYVNNNRAKASAIVQKQIDLNDSYMDIVWSQNEFKISLGQSLILSMEDEARWMIENNLTNEKTIPNFLDFIHTGYLKAVKPSAVRIVIN